MPTWLDGLRNRILGQGFVLLREARHGTLYRHGRVVVMLPRNEGYVARKIKEAEIAAAVARVRREYPGASGEKMRVREPGMRPVDVERMVPLGPAVWEREPLAAEVVADVGGNEVVGEGVVEDVVRADNTGEGIAVAGTAEGNRGGPRRKPGLKCEVSGCGFETDWMPALAMHRKGHAAGAPKVTAKVGRQDMRAVAYLPRGPITKVSFGFYANGRVYGKSVQHKTVYIKGDVFTALAALVTRRYAERVIQKPHRVKPEKVARMLARLPEGVLAAALKMAGQMR